MTQANRSPGDPVARKRPKEIERDSRRVPVESPPERSPAPPAQSGSPDPERAARASEDRGHVHDHDHADEHSHAHDEGHAQAHAHAHASAHGRGHEHDDGAHENGGPRTTAARLRGVLRILLGGHDHDHEGHSHGVPKGFSVRLELPLLLPETQAECDRCVARLQDAIRARRGIVEAHLETGHGASTLCLHYDRRALTLRDLTRLAEKAGARVTQQYRHENLWIVGMESTDAASALEQVLAREPGVLDASVSYASERARVEYDTTRTSRKKISDVLRRLGYRIEEEQTSDEEGHGHSHGAGLLWPSVSGLFLAAAFTAERLLDASPFVFLPLYVVAFVAGGFDLARHGLRSALKLAFDIEFLMIVAAIGAAALGRWAEGGLLLFLFSTGHALEHMALDRARRAVSTLGSVMPRFARVIRDGVERDVPVGELLRGDVVLSKPGERIPIDGRVIKGASAVDQSAITGESVPVEKSPGADVFAGTINGDGLLRIETTRLARDTTLARVMRLVQEAQTQKSPTQRFTERLERVFVPAVLVGVALVALVPPLVGRYAADAPWIGRLALPWGEAFLRSMTVLVAASPCALAISTPAAVLSGIAQGARRGVLFKGGAHLETLGRATVFAFDKTGTLTRGKPEVTRVAARPGVTREEILRVAASVEQQSGHPLARAVVRHAQAEGIPLSAASDLLSITGKGVVSTVAGVRVRVGSLKLFDSDARVPRSIVDDVRSFEEGGCTTMVVQRGAEFLGVIGVSDPIRDESRKVVQRLRSLGAKRLVMLTGDNERVAGAVAKEAGVDEAKSGLMPEDKVAAVRALGKSGPVAMVGDGVNDAPAMANASVGVAMGASGTDVALETADVALMADGLARLPFAVALSRKSRAIIRQNLVISLGVIALLLPSAVLGVAGIGIAIVLHEGSTLLVVANALRLLRFEEDAA